jgi:hypothetical protein
MLIRKLKDVLLLIGLIVLSVMSSCSWFSSNTVNTNANTNTNTNVAKDESQPTPPFSTKEPNQFQAKMIFSASLGGDLLDLPPQVYSVSRDGDKRRVEFEQNGERVAMLQIPSGQFLLNLTKKEYSNLNLAKLTGSEKNGSANNPFDKILNQTRPNANYEKLGQEEVEGRMTTKYRVTSQEVMNTGENPKEKVKVESFIWVDESLGMPIKSETNYISEGGPKGVKSTMIVREIKLETPAASLFEIPKDFKKV